MPISSMTRFLTGLRSAAGVLPVALAGLLMAPAAHATLVSLGACGGETLASHPSVPANGPTPLPKGCVIAPAPGYPIPNPVSGDPNNGILLAWNEVQNIVLPSDLRVDRVFDPTASFVTALPDGGYLIAAGTIVS